jgi:hypothetical protein
VTGYEPLSRAELLAVLAGRDGRIAQLEAENADLARRVARLERLISRNSGNSSFPPSADDLPGRTPPRGKPPRGGGRRILRLLAMIRGGGYLSDLAVSLHNQSVCLAALGRQREAQAAMMESTHIRQMLTGDSQAS